MNTSALKAFAPAVRRALMEAVERKLDVVLAASTPDYRTTLAAQVAALGELARADRAGLVERVAYTWFNRLAALRYLDARGWHPFRARVLTAAEAGSTQPELLKLAREGSLSEELKRHTDPARLDDLLDGRLPSPNAQGEVYRHLVLAACRFYHALLPDLFERLDDATELLLPDDLLTDQSVAAGFRTAISDEDCADVEVLGWLYQFYISEKKDAVMARKAAVPSADIPAVTQLFTPHWIVRYLVENSLGRLWLFNRPGSRLRERMPYYVETEPETDFLRVAGPEEIRVLDPAVGSGHMLTYAFDLLYAIYEEEGYAASEIPGLILRHNLYGVDIDLRAGQLAALALVLKARERSRRFFQPEQRVRPHVTALEDVWFAPGELREYVRALDLGPLFDEPVLRLLGQFEQATTFGSLMQPVLGADDIAQLRQAIDAKDVGGQLLLSATHQKVLRVLAQAEYLSRRYHVVVANPPYVEQDDMNAELRHFVAKHYPEGSADLCCAFILRNSLLADASGCFAMITMQSWMFLAGSTSLRERVLPVVGLRSMLHLGPHAFDAIPGEVVQTTAFVCTPQSPASRPVFYRVVAGRDEAEKREMFLSGGNRFESRSLTDLQSIPGTPLAYWVSDAALHTFRAFPSLGAVAEPRQGLITGDTGRFLRLWYEVSAESIGFECSDRAAAAASGKRWFPQDKGGPPRRWYGNNDYVVNWYADGRDVRNFTTPSGKLRSRPQNLDYYFRPGVTWTKISSGTFASRLTGPGFIFSDAGMKVFHSDELELLGIAGFLNSRVADQLLGCLSETINYEQGNIARLPMARTSGSPQVVSELVRLARSDWDDSEMSWDFRDFPLLRSGIRSTLLSASWQHWRDCRNVAVRRTVELEEANNQQFIRAYGLQGELSPAVPEKEVTLTRADAKRDAAALVSYAVGCMMGRFSLDRPGLVLADAGDTLAEYLVKVGTRAEALIFTPDVDGIIPVLDGEWFEDDAVARTREFLRATFGEATLRENVRWLEESLGKDLRKYFLTDFYKDHLQTYKKRPIYWLVQSPKKGFSVLIYLHRYTRDTLNVVLNRYLREYQGKMRNRLTQLAHDLAGDALPARDRTAARKEQDRLTKVLHECEEWERQALLPLAQQRLVLDLDDGVRANYLKLADVLAPIPGLAAAAD